VWNNVLVSGNGNGQDGPIIPNATASNWSFYFWNNTVFWGAGCTLEGGHGTAVVNYYYQNNHCIGNSGFTNENHSLMVPTGTDVESDNLAQTAAVANAQGYTGGQTYVYSPTAAYPANSTVGQGVNLANSMSSWVPTATTNDTAYACTEQTVSGVVESVCPARATIVRAATWDIGAYQWSSSEAGTITPPAGLIATAQ
jgi:hypothetical protein